MNKEELVTKWLEGDLSPEELKEFQGLPEHGAYHRIYNAAEHSRPETLDIEREFTRFQSRKDIGAKEKKRMGLNPWIGVAASIVLCVGLFFVFFNDSSTTIATQVAERTELNLPDESQVLVNAVSSVSYKTDEWKDDRRLSLQGEAFFRVAKGATFTVETDMGDVTVLGTQFNIRQRDSNLEVDCFEGRVRVLVRNQEHILERGQTLSLRNEKVSLGKTYQAQPSWVAGKSSFRSAPLKEVLEEFKRQYAVQIDMDDVDTSSVFSGSFGHDDLELAIQAITQPFKLGYELTGEVLKIRSHE